MALPPKEAVAKVVVDKDPVPTSFEKWGQPGHFDRTLAKGPKTTTWIWNLHANVHDFDSQTSDLEDISQNLQRPLRTSRRCLCVAKWNVLPRCEIF
jgi:photosystem I P700 chlorophyll a apoprotein A1